MSTSEEEGISISPREESPASNPLTNSENSSDLYPDSGVGLNGNHSSSRGHSLLTHSRARSRAPPLPPGPISASNGSYPSPITELRRPSIVEMMNSGGLVINQRGSCEINLGKHTERTCTCSLRIKVGVRLSLLTNCRYTLNLMGGLA